MNNWCCYLIHSLSDNCTYIGASNDPHKRLHTHNIGKGAKYTRGKQWEHVLIISGFTSKNACLSFESGWKKIAKKRANKNIECGLKYTKDTIWNRMLDLLYFTTNFTYNEPKFVCRRDCKLPKILPNNLLLCYNNSYKYDILYPNFIKYSDNI